MSHALKISSLESFNNTRQEHAQRILRQVNDGGAEYVDFRFTDLQGVWHHLSLHKNAIDEDLLCQGLMFDGSSINGWRPIHDSDMLLSPDATNMVFDQLTDHPTLIVFCSVIDPSSGELYSRDPRSVAIKGEEYLRQTGIADEARFGPEPEFFIFDEIHYETSPQNSFYTINWSEGAYPNSSVMTHSHGNMRHFGHKMLPGKGYFPVPPVDSANDLRAEMLSCMNTMGLKGDKHHHEVASGQHEIGFKYADLLTTGDNLQLFKYVIRNVAHKFNKTATFMPKPIYGDNGSGMHVHQSLWKNGQPLFPGNEYGGMSELALYYIGGIIHHARSLNAFTNPTTNSYKRLVPGYEAPVYIAYSARNRSAALRIPHIPDARQRRIEVRFPDATANGYLALTAMMMAGLDGIQNKIHPGEALDINLYDMKHDEHKYGLLCTSLQDALRSLNEDREYLLQGGVFTNDLIDAYIAIKQEEIHTFARAPHPIEFEMYYSI
jgi:glutamine synthetase